MSEETDVRAFPAPEQLATPTDLSPEVARKITEALSPLVADAFASYAKTKNFHWHLLSGARFRTAHPLLDEQAETIFRTTDPLAERLRRIGGTTIRSISHVNRLQTLSDGNEEAVDPDDVIRRVMEDNKHIAAKQPEAHGICDENGDAATAGLLEEVIDGTGRRTWFLCEYLKDADRFD